MKTSQNGLDLIKKYEGCRLNAYRCPGGVFTIGYGHTSGVKAGMKITQEQANKFLLEDIKTAEAAVNKYMDKYSFNQNQYDALVSFAFNIGNISQLTQNGTRTIIQIADMMLEYTKAGGQVMAGLINRRREERKLFISPVAEVQISLPEIKESMKVKTIVDKVIAGDFGNGEQRKQAIYQAIQNLVNERMKKS